MLRIDVHCGGNLLVVPYLCLVTHTVVFGPYIVISFDLMYKVSGPFKTRFYLIRTMLQMDMFQGGI